MNKQVVRRCVGASAVGLGVGSLLALRWSTSAGLGVLAGGSWGLLNLWCLARALPVWLGPDTSRRRSLSWFAVKFPLLYLAAFVLLSHPSISPVGFGLGFTLVLIAAGASALGSFRPRVHRAAADGR